MAIVELLTSYKFQTVLDVGSGSGKHSKIFKMARKTVFSIDKFEDHADSKADILEFETSEKFDCIFCSHVVEHQRNCGLFLDKLYSLLKDDGILCIIGPCHDPNTLIEGHLKTWTTAIALQNLVLAGFDCSHAFIYQFHETGIICKKAPAFTVTTASYKFLNQSLWPFEPVVRKLVNEQGVLFHGNSTNTYKFGTSKAEHIEKVANVRVLDTILEEEFVVLSSRFSNIAYHFESGASKSE